jgi:hypothetical protein
MTCRNASNADADCLQLEDFQNQQWQFPDEDQASIEEFWKPKEYVILRCFRYLIDP